MTDERFKAMRDEARQEYAAKVKVTRILESLPGDTTRAKVLRAAAIMLDCPEAMGDKPNPKLP